MEYYERLRLDLSDLRQQISRDLEIAESVHVPVPSHPLGQGQLEVKRGEVCASVLLNPTQHGGMTIDILPQFVDKPWRHVETELLLHLEATATLWRTASSGQHNGVSCIPVPAITELWLIPRPRLGEITAKCECVPLPRTVGYTELHVTVYQGVNRWWLLRLGEMDDRTSAYAALTCTGLFQQWRDRAFSRAIRECLLNGGARRVS